MKTYLSKLVAIVRGPLPACGLLALALLCTGGCVVRPTYVVATPVVAPHYVVATGRYYYDPYGRVVYVRPVYAPRVVVAMAPAPVLRTAKPAPATRPAADAAPDGEPTPSVVTPATPATPGLTTAPPFDPSTAPAAVPAEPKK